MNLRKLENGLFEVTSNEGRKELFVECFYPINRMVFEQSLDQYKSVYLKVSLKKIDHSSCNIKFQDSEHIPEHGDSEEKCISVSKFTVTVFSEDDWYWIYYFKSKDQAEEFLNELSNIVNEVDINMEYIVLNSGKWYWGFYF